MRIQLTATDTTSGFWGLQRPPWQRCLRGVFATANEGEAVGG